MISLLILFVGGIILTIGDIVAKQWVLGSKRTLYVATLLLYLVGLNFLIASYKYEDIAVASLLIEIFNIITLTFVSIKLYKEYLTRERWLGIIVALLAIIVLEL